MTVLSHVYSEYSLLSSTNRIDSLVAQAKAYGYKALALTDHHVMYGAVPFYEACLKHEIKPIFGLEVTIKTEKQLALLRLYAKNEQGYSHLLKLATIIGHKDEKEAFLTRAEISPYLSDLLIVMPYKTGPLFSFIEQEDMEAALSWWKIWKEGTDEAAWFHELRVGLKEDERSFLHQFVKRTDVELLASHPCFFTNETDEYAYRVARAIRDGVMVDEMPVSQEERQFYLQTKERLEEMFHDERAALMQTEQLALQCSVQLALGKTQLPTFIAEDTMKADERLRLLCEQGMKERYGDITPVMRERLETELAVITEMGFCDYFLIVWDLMKYAREQRILTGPGRGSAAGSLVAYVLAITNVDPLKYELLFERFLNHERVSMPDIDIDFPDHRRDEVIAYVQQKYGKDHVAQIMTFGTLGARAVIRDVGRALGTDHAIIERVAKSLPQSYNTTLEKARQEMPQLQKLIQESEETLKLWQTAEQLEGLPRHVSTHAAGIVISGKSLSSIVALQKGHASISLTQAAMNVIEKLGLLKFDFLGLRNLTLLERMTALIEKHHHTKLELETIPFDDPNTYKLLSAGDTTGIFQLESKGMRRVLSKLRPSHFEDIVAVNALYRPGPMEFIQTYIDGKYGKRSITYVHPDLEPILKKTYGVIVYQEQIMQIAALLAGFTLAEADLLRRAISKKNKEELAKRREDFIAGALRNGYAEQVAINVFSLIERFADYGFNRSHAVAYSMISYQLAFIKVHYPFIFYTALFSSVWNNHEKLFHHIQECKAKGYTVLPPSLNKSEGLFTIDGDAIRFGLLPISHVGIQAVQEITRVRAKKRFNDFFDFILRVDQRKVTKKVIEQLIKAGAMDEFGEDRATLLHSLEKNLERAADVKKFQRETGGLFTIDVEVPHYEEVEPFHFYEKLELEKEALGLYLSGHPLDRYRRQLMEVGRMSIYEALMQTQSIRIAGMLIKIRMIRTATGEKMAFARLSDETMDVELVLFPKVWQMVEQRMIEGMLVLIEGKIEERKGRKQVIVQKITELKLFFYHLEKKEDILFLRIVPSLELEEPLQQVKEQLLAYKGTVPVILYYERTKDRKQLPQTYAVTPSDACIEALKEILGPENVVLRNASN